MAHQPGGCAPRRGARGAAAPGRASSHRRRRGRPQRLRGRPIRAAPADPGHDHGPGLRRRPDRGASHTPAQRRPCHGPGKVVDPEAARVAGAHRYRALDPELLLWVQATLVVTSIHAYRRWVGPVSDAEADELWQEARGVGTRLGIPLRSSPVTWSALTDYWQRMLDTDGLIQVTDAARGLAPMIIGASPAPPPGLGGGRPGAAGSRGPAAAHPGCVRHPMESASRSACGGHQHWRPALDHGRADRLALHAPGTRRGAAGAGRGTASARRGARTVTSRPPHTWRAPSTARYACPRGPVGCSHRMCAPGSYAQRACRPDGWASQAGIIRSMAHIGRAQVPQAGIRGHGGGAQGRCRAAARDTTVAPRPSHPVPLP